MASAVKIKYPTLYMQRGQQVNIISLCAGLTASLGYTVPVMTTSSDLKSRELGQGG